VIVGVGGASSGHLRGMRGQEGSDGMSAFWVKFCLNKTFLTIHIFEKERT
jgi:hypothetical protein